MSPPGDSSVAARVRVWDERAGTYENAVTASLMFGQTEIFQQPLPQQFYPPINLTNLVSLIGPLTPFPLSKVPTNTVVAPGGNAQLSVELLSMGYTFQWQRESQPPGVPPPTPLWTNLPGATSNVFSIINATVADEGRYRVVVEYGCTNRVAGPAHLIVASAILSRPTVRASDKALLFDVNSPAGASFELLSSADLVVWIPAATYTNVPAHWSIVVTNAESHRFFKLKNVP